MCLNVKYVANDSWNSGCYFFAKQPRQAWAQINLDTLAFEHQIPLCQMCTVSLSHLSASASTMIQPYTEHFLSNHTHMISNYLLHPFRSSRFRFYAYQNRSRRHRTPYVKRRWVVRSYFRDFIQLFSVFVQLGVFIKGLKIVWMEYKVLPWRQVKY